MTAKLSLKQKFEQERPQMHWILRHWPLLRQLIKFFLVGFLTALVDLGLFFLLRGLGVHFIVANLISVALAITLNFILNKFWTFRQKQAKHVRRQLVEFFILNGIFYVLQQLALYYGVLLLPQPIFTISSDIVLKILIVFVLGLAKFIISRVYIFAQKRLAPSLE